MCCVCLSVPLNVYASKATLHRGARAAVLYANQFAHRVRHLVIEDMHFMRRTIAFDDADTSDFRQTHASWPELVAACAAVGLDEDWALRKRDEGMVRQNADGTWFLGSNPLVGDEGCWVVGCLLCGVCHHSKCADRLGSRLDQITRFAFRLLMDATDERVLATAAEQLRDDARLLAVRAARSPACSDSAIEALRRAVPRLRDVTVPRSNHSVHGSQTDAFARLLADTLASTDALVDSGE